MSFTFDDHDGVLVLRMAAPKANSMSPEFVSGLRAAINEAEDLAPGSLVITGSGRAFSAGLALPVLVELPRDELRTFMVDFGQAMESVLTFPRPTVAAVNGHAVAGGCVLAVMCDYAVMAQGSARIGLNEVALGIGLPAIVIEPFRARLPARSLAPVALAAELFEPDEALALDLVADVVAPDALEAEAVERARALTGAPAAFRQVKAALLRPVLAEIRRHEDAELEAWLDTWFSADGQRLVGAAVEALRR